MTRRNFRVICDCQRHAIRERTLWRRRVRAAKAKARLVRSGGVALLFAVPLAFGAINIPSEAMDMLTSSNRFQIFTTERVRKDFLAPRVVKPQTPRSEERRVG